MARRWGPLQWLRRYFRQKARSLDPKKNRKVVWWLERASEKGSLRGIICAVATVGGQTIAPTYAEAIGLLGTIAISSILFSVKEQPPARKDSLRTADDEEDPHVRP